MSETSSLTLRAIGAQPTVRSQVAKSLRDALVCGQMEPGVVYSAPALAAMLGVSATPVREAMLDLTHEGLVETVRNKGFRVTELSARDLDELAALRSLIEVPTIGEVARIGNPDTLDALRPLAEEITEAAERADLITFIRADTSFHLQLLALAGNRVLVEQIAQLRSRTRLYGLRKLAADGALASSAREHSELLDLLLAREATAAEELMRRHIGHIRGTWAGNSE